MSYNHLKKMEKIGFFVTLFLGIILHFSYGFSNKAMWSILFGSVNESIWEHVKIFAMPYLFWTVITYARMRLPFRHFVVSKILSLYVFIIISVSCLSLYTSIVGSISFVVEMIFISIAVAAAYMSSYKIIINFKNIDDFFVLSLFLLVLFLAMYICFSVAPPQIGLFRDAVTGHYGIR
ncbi:MAG: DUF6512 family protein [Bacillota bacterium]|nr:DUF6512 family protein [Bacillota bacterium]